MPETYFCLRWPDDGVTENYSPSSVVHDHFKPGDSFALADFLPRAQRAMSAASDRVREKYGFSCARAAATLADIEQKAGHFANQPNATVTVLEMTS